MAKDKDRALNPAAAHLKAQKKTALKKGKAQLAVQRNEKLARRNPERLQRQIDDLKTTEAAHGGNLRPRDKQLLEQLERDVKAIRKAREADPSYSREARSEHTHAREAKAGHGNAGRGGQVTSLQNANHTSLGKRRRGWHDADDGRTDNEEETDTEVRKIPMPRDTPPPIPPRPRRQRRNEGGGGETGGRNTKDPAQRAQPLPSKPAPVSQTTYSSAPQMRNLQKEAIAKFVPAAVASRLKQRAAFSGTGAGGAVESQKLLEPEEVDALERDGYLDRGKAKQSAANELSPDPPPELGLDEEGAALVRELAEAERDLDMEAEVEREAGNHSRLRGTAMAEEASAQTRNPLLRYHNVEDIEDDDW